MDIIQKKRNQNLSVTQNLEQFQHGLSLASHRANFSHKDLLLIVKEIKASI
ncbi:MAG: hypothetical protein WBL44_01155 [Nitrososphaeraceae archaeon]